MSLDIRVGDALEVLPTLPSASVQCVVTSPPYFGLRDYGHDGQIGFEETPDEYVASLVAVFREVRRVLRDDGTLWLNLGDSYAGSGPSGAAYQSETTKRRAEGSGKDGVFRVSKSLAARGLTYANKKPVPPPGLKAKDLLGIPWRVAFALQADGWYLRQDIIWHKPNPMPESVTDRCTKAHEYIFLLSKSRRYYYDADAIAESSIGTTGTPRFGGTKYGDSLDPKHATESGKVYKDTGTRNRRSVWTVATQPYPDAHFATYPPELIRPAIQAGSKPNDTILDPFNGAGTTGLVALQMNRKYIGIELNPEYAHMTRERLAPLINQPRLLEVTA